MWDLAGAAHVGMKTAQALSARDGVPTKLGTARVAVPAGHPGCPVATACAVIAGVGIKARITHGCAIAIGKEWAMGTTHLERQRRNPAPVAAILAIVISMGLAFSGGSRWQWLIAILLAVTVGLTSLGAP